LRQSLAHVALLVRDYDEALAYFVGRLDFRLLADTPLGGGKRWVLVAPPGARESALLLAREEAYGTVAVFEDLYGNRWDLLQPRETAAP
jgi:catechol 2,3-dioxygenase-like lactoylglutathione lyase family enzyme